MTANLFGVSSDELLSLKRLVTQVVYPFSPEYNFYRLNYNHLFNYYPVAIVRAHRVKDIVNTIKFCRKNNLPIRARSGAHAYEPASLVNFGVIIDQRPRDKIISINKKKQTARIEAGALLGPLINTLSEKNINIPFGTCCTNGMAGLTLGGGIGFSLRQFGLTSDVVKDFKIVLANGDVIHANKKCHSDLFFALRGAGGGNFGVVTDFTYKTSTAKWVTIFTMLFDFNDAKEVFKTWQLWAPFTDTKLTSEMDIFNRFQPTIVTGQLLPGISPEADQKLLFELIQPLVKLGLHSTLSIKTQTLNEAAEYFTQGSYARPLFFHNKSDFNFRPLPDQAIDTIIYFMGLLNRTQTHNKTEIDALAGNFAKIPSDATAFPSRKAIHWFQYTSLWDTTEQTFEGTKWLDDYYQAMRPFFPLNRRYVNALQFDTPRLKALKSYFGQNLLKLIRIKTKYDPTDFFRFEQSIPVINDPIFDANRCELI